MQQNVAPGHLVLKVLLQKEGLKKKKHILGKKKEVYIKKKEVYIKKEAFSHFKKVFYKRSLNT